MSGKTILFAAPSAYILSGLAIWLDYLLPGLQQKRWDPILGLVTGNIHVSSLYLQHHPYERIALVANSTGTREGRVRAFCDTISLVDPAIVVSVNIPDAILATDRLRRTGNRYRRSVMAIHGLGPDIFGDALRFSKVLDGVCSTNKLGCALAIGYSGIDTARVHYAQGGTRMMGGLREVSSMRAPIRLLYVGRLEQSQKRVYDTIAILSILVRRGIDCELTLLGAGPEEGELRRRVEEEGLVGSVRFERFRPQEEVERDFYPVADLLLVTSPCETGPLVAWEAMAHGVPLVSSRYTGSGIESALVHGENALLFPVGDVEKAADCVVALTDARLRETVVKEGRALVERRYSFAASIEAWDRAFHAVMSAPPLPERKGFDSFPISGRLDRWLGVRRAENVRRAFGVRFEHTDAGGEWPHSYGDYASKEEEFWECASRLDGEVLDEVSK